MTVRRSSFFVVAAVTLTGSVLAQATAVELPDVAFSGRARAFLFAADRDKTPTEPFKSVNAFANAALYADTKTIFDNGIELRTVVELNAYGSELLTGRARNLLRADRVYADINTAFGRLRVGQREGANATILEDPAPQAFLSPSEDVVGDILKARTNVTTRDAATFKRFADRAFALGYETPALLPGLRLGLSYHPSTGTDRRTIGRRQSAKHGIDVSGRYEGRYPGGTYRIAAGYFRSDSRTGGASGTQAWNTLVRVTYGGWEASATYLTSDPQRGPDDETWTGGVLYGIGPFKISADYLVGQRDLVAGARATEHVKRASLQGQYRVRQGVSVGLTGFHVRQRDSLGREWDGVGALTGVKFSF
ncbi:MAG: porin [Rhodospirillaceae bacterium]|nr:porin [Rhodospirillaceae bacterium]